MGTDFIAIGQFHNDNKPTKVIITGTRNSVNNFDFSKAVKELNTKVTIDKKEDKQTKDIDNNPQNTTAKTDATKLPTKDEINKAFQNKYGVTIDEIKKKIEENDKKAKQKNDEITHLAVTEKSSQGLTYKDALGIIDMGKGGMMIRDSKTGELRYPTDEEALELLKQQADNFPQTRGIYEKYKKAYEAKLELEKKYPEFTEIKIWGEEFLADEIDKNSEKKSEQS